MDFQKIDKQLDQEEWTLLNSAYNLLNIVCLRREVCDTCKLRNSNGPCIIDILGRITGRDNGNY